MTPLTDRLMRLSKRLEDEGLYVNANLVHEAATRLNAAEGYLLNAKIDLETQTPKRTALNTIEGGLQMLRADLTEPAS
jgi:hypothetical protein